MAILKQDGWLITHPALDNRAAVARLAAAMERVRKARR